MHRFYFSNADFSKKSILITDRDEIHHIKDVLRLKAGDEVCIFNGSNQEAKAEIASVKQDQVEVRIQSIKEGQPPAKVKIILACAVPKKAKFEFIIEKCTELGVDEIIPLRTKRTEVVFAKEKTAAKQARFQKVAVNAAKQSGRRDVPKIHPMISLAEALKICYGNSVVLIPSLNGQPRHIREILMSRPQTTAVAVFIGPEGDFTPDEVQTAQSQGAVPVSLGTTVLKVDTAAISTVALVRFLCAD